MAEKTFTYPVSLGNATDFAASLNWLNEKLDSVQKQVSYFDFYNITGAVSDYNLFSAQINSLPLNESLVVNTPPFYYNGENYSPGDIIIKNSLGNIHHIKAQTGGVYYPKTLTKNGEIYVLQYAFSDSSPTLSSSTVDVPEDGSSVSAEFAEVMTYQGLKETQTTNIYGEYGKLNKSGIFSFDAVYSTPPGATQEEVVWPFIQFFITLDDATPLEQIFLDYNLELRNRQWAIFIPDYKENSNIYVKVK